MTTDTATASKLTRLGAQIEKDIQEAINLGGHAISLANKASSSDEYSLAKAAGRKFSSYAEEVLRQSFSTDRELRSFRGSGALSIPLRGGIGQLPTPVSTLTNELRESLSLRVENLENLVHTLGLRAESPQTSAEPRPHAPQITVNGNVHGLQVGSGNTHIRVRHQLFDAIESSSAKDGQKTEAKNLLERALRHPLLGSILSAVLSSQLDS